MNLSDYTITLNGNPVVKADSFPDTRSKNQKRKDRKKYFSDKRKASGSLEFEIKKERWIDRILVKGE